MRGSELMTRGKKITHGILAPLRYYCYSLSVSGREVIGGHAIFHERCQQRSLNIIRHSDQIGEHVVCAAAAASYVS